MSEKEKADAEADKKRLSELKKKAYTDYFTMSEYDIKDATSTKEKVVGDKYNSYKITRKYDLFDAINDEDITTETKTYTKYDSDDEEVAGREVVEDKKRYRDSYSMPTFVVGNVNHTTHTFTIIGYLFEEYKEGMPHYSANLIRTYIKKSKTPLTITYPAPKTKACKTTKLQKDLKKLTMNYELPA
jgi:hypothetical protein